MKPEQLINKVIERFRPSDSMQIDAQRTRTLQDMRKAAYPEHHINAIEGGLLAILALIVVAGTAVRLMNDNFAIEQPVRPTATATLKPRTPRVTVTPTLTVPQIQEQLAPYTQPR